MAVTLAQGVEGVGEFWFWGEGGEDLVRRSVRWGRGCRCFFEKA